MITINGSDIKISRVDIYQQDGSVVKSALQITDIEAVERANNGQLPKFLIVQYDLHRYGQQGHYTEAEEVVLSYRASKTGNKGFYKQVTPNERTLAYVAIDDARAEQLALQITKQTTNKPTVVTTQQQSTTPIQQSTPAQQPAIQSIKPGIKPITKQSVNEEDIFL